MWRERRAPGGPPFGVPFQREKTSRAVLFQKSPIDRRPFQSKAERDREQSLESQYRSVAIRDVAAVIRQPKTSEAGMAS